MFRKNDGVADLVTKANQLGKLNQEFLKYVPTPVNQHVQLANVHGKHLHVIADSPAWAAKFRYMSGHLVPTLKKNIKYFQYVTEISVSSTPSRFSHKKTTKQQPRNITPSAKSCLENVAAGLEEGQLKTNLYRLASRHKQK